MINILLWMGCSIKSTVELRNTKKAYETAQISIYGDFYDDVIRTERVPNSVKKYINREVLYELAYANSQMQKSWEEYAGAEYQSSLIYTEKAQEHIARALELHQETEEANQEANQEPKEDLEEENKSASSEEQISSPQEAEGEQVSEEVESDSNNQNIDE